MFVPPSPASGSEETPVKVTRSIMIKRPAGYPSSPRSAASTPPASPLGTTPPISPFAGAGECPARDSAAHFACVHFFRVRVGAVMSFPDRAPVPCLIGSVVTGGFRFCRPVRKRLDGAYWGRGVLDISAQWQWVLLALGSPSWIHSWILSYLTS